MLKLYSKALIFIIIAIAFIGFIDRFCVQDELFHQAYNKLKDKEVDYDFIYMGNSLSTRSFDTRSFDSILGTNSLNIGSSAQHFSITRRLFLDFIDNEDLQPNKALIVGISPWQFKDYDTERLKFLQMAALDEVKFSADYFKILKKFYSIEDYPKVLSPTVRFHNELPENIEQTHNRLKVLKAGKSNGFELFVSTKLNQEKRNLRKNLKGMAAQYPTQIANAKAYKLSQEYENLILDIVNKCSELNLKVIFVTAPSINMLYEKNDFGFFKYIENLLMAQNVTYVNLNTSFNELNLDYDDFSDLVHLNKFGIKKAGPMFLDILTKETNIPVVINTETIKPQIEKDSIPIPAKPVQSTISLTHWNTIRVNLEPSEFQHQNQEVYKVSRSVADQTAYLISKRESLKGELHKVSLVVKKGDNNSNFGLRIQGVYPNRVDAVFNLDKGIVDGVSKNGDFTNEKAQIESLGDGWFRCTLFGKVQSNSVNVICGPTDKSLEVIRWEAPTHTSGNIYFVPNTLRFEKVN
ncbi:phage head spike fiber domain-containing protein [Psychroserpens algicola]|uniref:phage head spike fiber domain-containing protein n=1 Tax=Psychroserpens algicola TaxID=1719034 RepID=UPI0019540828|nr:hypothetical protein [Psychroserpens algicola]